MKVLIVDDDIVTRTVVCRLVSSLGHDCTTAGDGEEAWRAYQTRPFDVIISDLVMPGMDGFALCQRLREHRGSDNYPYFICMTSQQDQDMFLQAMIAGADDFVIKPVALHGLHARLIAAERVTGLHRELFRQRRELETLNNRLFEEGRIDALTKVGNRLALNEALEAAIDHAVRYESSFSLAIFDVDYFKLYNDSYGHLAGDDVLRKVAKGFKGEARASDGVFRFGGEEFVVILPEQTLGLAAPVVDRHRETIAALGTPHGASPMGIVTVSAGVACVRPTQPRTPTELMKEADSALYMAKQSGRNRVGVVDNGDVRLWVPDGQGGGKAIAPAPAASETPSPGR